MGHWGEGLLENDTADEVIDFWELFITRGRDHDADFWTDERVFDLLRLSWFKGVRDVDLDNAEHNARVLAVGALFLQHDLSIPPALQCLLARSANAELRPSRLSEWKTPKARERVLVKLLKTIGAERVAVSTKHPLETEIAELEAWSKHYPRWSRIQVGLREGRNVLASSPDALDEWERLEPSFLRTIWTCIGTGTDHPREALRNRSMMHRLMCLAFMTGWFVGLSEEETLALIERARATKGGKQA
jgi:hypothetical protein